MFVHRGGQSLHSFQVCCLDWDACWQGTLSIDCRNSNAILLQCQAVDLLQPGSNHEQILKKKEPRLGSGLNEDGIRKIPACRQVGRIPAELNSSGDSASRFESEEALVDIERFPNSNV